MRRVVIFKVVLVLFFSLGASAQESENKEIDENSTTEKIIEKTVDYGEQAYDLGKKAVKKTNEKLGQSRKNRQNKDHAVFFNYALFNTWLPSRYGFAYSYISSESETWEIDWNRSSIGYNVVIADLGKMTENRISFMRQSYSKRNSFYYSYGLNYYEFEAYLGEKFLVNIPNSPPTSIDLLKISSIGVSLALGNRWHFKNWVIGFDWVAVHLPVIILNADAPFLDYATNQSDRESVEDAVDIVKRMPTFTALKFQLGYSF